MTCSLHIMMGPMIREDRYVWASMTESTRPAATQAATSNCSRLCSDDDLLWCSFTATHHPLHLFLPLIPTPPLCHCHQPPHPLTPLTPSMLLMPAPTVSKPSTLASSTSSCSLLLPVFSHITTCCHLSPLGFLYLVFFFVLFFSSHSCCSSFISSLLLKSCCQSCSLSLLIHLKPKKADWFLGKSFRVHHQKTNYP